MRVLGLIIVVLSLLAPLYWYVEQFQNWDFIPVFSQLMGVWGLIAMAIILLLATRLSFLEVIFGSLDRIYILHKWLGIGALVVVFIHNQLDAEIENGMRGWFRDLGESLGGTSLDMLQILVAVTLITLIPYHWWRWTHKLMGVLYILGVAHFAMIDKPFQNNDPLALYVFVFCAIGILSYIYTLLPLRMLGKSRAYQVSSIEKTGSSTAVSLLPRSSSGFKHKAGQFAFIKFEQNGLKEMHPFTISQAPNESRSLRFTIKGLGDYTNKLGNQLLPETTVNITGPYGHFRSRFGKEGAVWIAGGIGITPFLAWSQELTQDSPKVDLFYCVPNRESAAHLDELVALDNRLSNFTLHLMESKQGQRLNADKIIQVLGDRWPRVRVAYCGPATLREAIKTGLKEKGLSNSRFYYEEFEIRTGIGLDRIILWIWPKILPIFKKVLKLS